MKQNYRVEISAFSDELESKWRKLIANSLESTIFQDPKWITSWLETGSDKVQFAVVYSGEEMVALAPFVTKNGSCIFTGCNHSDFNLFLVHHKHSAVSKMLIETLAADSTWGRIVFRDVPRESKTLVAITESGFPIIDEHHLECPLTDLRDEDNNHRIMNKKNTKRKRNKLAKHGTIEVHHTTKKNEILKALPELFCLHEKRWNTTPHQSQFSTPSGKKFFELMVSKGMPLLYSKLSVDNHTVACHLGIIDGEKFLWYKPAYDSDFAPSSPGEILLQEVIKEAIRLNMKWFDFTKGNEGYKSRYATEIKYNETLILYSNAPCYVIDRMIRQVRSKLGILKRRLYENSSY